MLLGWLDGAALEVMHAMCNRMLVPRPRREAISGAPPADGGIDSSSTDLIAAEERRQLEEAIERLPPRYAEILALTRVGRLSRSEVGVRLGISPNAASKLHQRAILRLRMEVNDESRGVPARDGVQLPGTARTLTLSQ